MSLWCIKPRSVKVRNSFLCTYDSWWFRMSNITSKITLRRNDYHKSNASKSSKKKKSIITISKSRWESYKRCISPNFSKITLYFSQNKIPLKAMMKSVYLNTMPMSSISPAGRRQCHQIMRKVNKYINQIPMPNCIRIRVRPTLHKFIISIP